MNPFVCFSRISLCFFTVACVGASILGAELSLKLPSTRRSQQFVVHDGRLASPAPSILASATNRTGMIELSPDVLLVSAERIRDELYKQLGLPGQDAGKIHLLLKRPTDGDRGITIVSGRYADGWQYRVDIPDPVEDIALARGLVEVLLLEFANRYGGPKSAEIPAWLVEGLSSHLLVAGGPRLIFSSVPVGSVRRLIRDLEGADPLREAREFFSSHHALGFSELSVPDVAQLTGDRLKAYRHSAHILVFELCRLRGGKQALLGMLRELPHCWNWQTAFLRAFQPAFERLLDVEKWWAVTLAGFVGRDQRQAWSREICLQRLDETLLVSAQVPRSNNAIPVRVQATLQQVIAEWEYDLQKAVLPQVINRLTALRYQAPTNVIPIIDAYRVCLHTYLQKRAQAGYSPSNRRSVSVRPSQLIEETVIQIDELLRQREALRRSIDEEIAASTKPH